MEGDYIPLVSFSCTAKIYLAEERRLSNEHSCRFSLETLNSEPYLRVEGQGIRPKRIKVCKSFASYCTESESNPKLYASHSVTTRSCLYLEEGDSLP